MGCIMYGDGVENDVSSLYVFVHSQIYKLSFLIPLGKEHRRAVQRQ